MHIKIVGLHAPHAARLQALLGQEHQVEGLPAFPETGELRADVVIANQITAQQAGRLRCRLVQVPGAGTEQVAVQALPPASWVSNVHGHEVPIAEFVVHAILEHMLALWNCPPVLDETAFPRVYAKRPMHDEAAAKTLTLVGYGHIGREVARRARALDMRVIAVTRSGKLPDDGMVDRCVPVARLHDVLPESHVLLLCCPLDESTRGLIGQAELNLLPPNALLVNVARAEVAQEEALYDALAQGRLGRAALDVWYQYPKPGQTELAPSRLPFHQLPNVRCTPHVSALTPGLLERRYRFMAGNILRLHAGEPLQNVVRAAS
jgi:phosphoglycerate dehydrogenase-like enzyme